jgi:hypothetical protein
MLSKTKLIRPFLIGFGAVLGGLLVSPPFVYAHGMGLEEMGPPFATSVGLAFAFYWLMMLWPFKSRDVPALEMPGQATDTIRIKQKPRLRVVERRLVNE